MCVELLDSEDEEVVDAAVELISNLLPVSDYSNVLKVGLIVALTNGSHMAKSTARFKALAMLFDGEILNSESLQISNAIKKLLEPTTFAELGSKERYYLMEAMIGVTRSSENP